MKIGILTFHNADNYGAVLQCYALQEYVKSILRKEDKVYVVNYWSKKIRNIYKLFPQKNGLKFKSIILDLYRSFHTIKRNIEFNNFRKKYLDLGPDVFDDYDLIIYGRDQIWNSTIKDDIYWGINYHKKKIAYSASCGGEFIISDKALTLLNEYDKISCRESSFTKQLSMLLKREIYTTCDPVFLINTWGKIAANPNEVGYILLYVIMPNHYIEDEAIRLGKILHKKIVRIDWINQVNYLFNVKIHNRIAISVEKFLGYIANADLILTTSFHGTAFSILFRKPFYVFKINKRMDRIIDLLNTIGLSQLYVDKIPSNKIPEQIYSRDIENNISEYIEYSKKVLTSFIGNL